MSEVSAHLLDDELWQSILCQLTLIDTLNFSRTCKRFWSVAQEDTVWQSLFATEFNSEAPSQQTRRWKAIFKQRFAFCAPQSCLAAATYLLDEHTETCDHCRAQDDRVRLRKRRQARIMHLQNKAQASCIELCQLLSNVHQSAPYVQISSANVHHAKAALADHRAKLKNYHTEMQVLKRLRYAFCCKAPAFSSFLDHSDCNCEPFADCLFSILWVYSNAPVSCHCLIHNRHCLFETSRV